MNHDYALIRRLVGDITSEQLRFVDSFVSEKVGLFMPVAGPCYYALTPRHTHPSYMFCYPFNDGLATVMADGRVFAAEKGKIQALSPGIPHHEPVREVPPRYVAIMIAADFFEEQYRFYSSLPVLRFGGECYEPVKQLLPYLREFMIESGNEIPGATAVLTALGLQICHAIIRSVLRIDRGDPTGAERLEINQALEFLHDNIDQKLTVAAVAGQVGMSASHFNRLFKAETGRTPLEYLFTIRMAKAKKLLLAGEKTISEIAAACGFGSPAYFAERFHQTCQMSPREYRNRGPNP